MNGINYHRVWAVVMRHLMSWPRSLERIADAFWWPMLSLFLWGLVTIFLQEQTGAYQFFINLFLGGVIMWLFVYRSQEEMGIMFLQEAWDRNLLNMFTSPLTIWEFTLAAFVLSLVKLTLSVIFMTILGYVFFRYNIFLIGWALIPYAVSLLITGGTLGLFINSLIIRFGYRIQVLAWSLVGVLQPFSGVFYPVHSMPEWMQVVARIVPSSYIFEGMRTVLREGRVDYMGLGIATILHIVYGIFTVRFFLWSFRKAREKGMLMKFS